MNSKNRVRAVFPCGSLIPFGFDVVITSEMNTIEAIQDTEYLRKRLNPKYRDEDYLHLVDLKVLLDQLTEKPRDRVLDFGCGGSPYRSLFTSNSYLRADFGDAEQLDYVIDGTGRIEEADSTFDLVLSTQVAEHVVDPRVYFSECARLLKSGGELICTTHGIYPDHGCPYDFQRWTVDGLKRDIEAAGLTVTSAYKLTTNARALMYLIQRFSGWFDSSKGLLSPALRLLRSYMHRYPGLWQKTADRLFCHQQVVTDEIPGHDFYIGVCVCAVKDPAAST